MRRLLVIMLAGALVLGTTAPVSAADHLGDPKKVAICHFDGHEWGGEGTFGPGFDGDYVINFVWSGDSPGVGDPLGPDPTYCESNPGGQLQGFTGNMIIVSVNAAFNGHGGVQGLDRIDDYPDGWKG